MGFQISISSSNKKFEKLNSLLLNVAEKTLKALKMKNASFAIYLVENDEMRRLNNSFRNKDYVANILSFKEPEGFPHPELGRKKGIKMLGEIYLPPDFIKKSEMDLTHLLIHGILHLVGYTHERERDSMNMEKKEKQLMDSI